MSPLKASARVRSPYAVLGMERHFGATAATASFFVMRADEKLTALLELETAIRPTSAELHFLTKSALATQFALQGNQAERSESEQRNCRAVIGDAHPPRG
jgi:hypothetical protein